MTARSPARTQLMYVHTYTHAGQRPGHQRHGQHPLHAITKGPRRVARVERACLEQVLYKDCDVLAIQGPVLSGGAPMCPKDCRCWLVYRGVRRPCIYIHEMWAAREWDTETAEDWCEATAGGLTITSLYFPDPHGRSPSENPPTVGQAWATENDWGLTATYEGPADYIGSDHRPHPGDRGGNGVGTPKTGWVCQTAVLLATYGRERGCQCRKGYSLPM